MSVAAGSGARVLRYGALAALVEVADLAAVLRLYDALRADRPDGVVELVPAARTLLVAFDDRSTSFDTVSSAISAIAQTWTSFEAPNGPQVSNSADGGGWNRTRGGGGAGDADREGVVEVPVHYDGPDLARVADLTGLDEAEVVARHTAGDYRSGFCGFAPGFAYLTGLDDSLYVARRDDPRTAVPAGSVALADEFTAVYPRESPGGWQLVGRTDVVLWDTDRDPPALLVPGTPVRFVDAGAGS